MPKYSHNVCCVLWASSSIGFDLSPIKKLKSIRCRAEPELRWRHSVCVWHTPKPERERENSHYNQHSAGDIHGIQFYAYDKVSETLTGALSLSWIASAVTWYRLPCTTGTAAIRRSNSLETPNEPEKITNEQDQKVSDAVHFQHTYVHKYQTDHNYIKVIYRLVAAVDIE